MERITHIKPAFDKRSTEPSKNYGIHNCEMFMVLKGELGAVVFSFNTGWFLPRVHEELYAKAYDMKPKGVAVAYCSPKPLHSYQEGRKDCDWLGCTCYGDCAYIMSDIPMNLLITEGSDAVWKWLENYYNEIFKL